MADKKDDNIDLILSFANKYHNLYEQDKINKQQLMKVLELLDDFGGYSYREFEQQLKNIFSDKGS